MYVSAYSSRPVLHVVDKSGIQKPYALTFADALTRYKGEVNEDLLGEAYRRAGTSFKGQLEQHFVVLREAGVQGGYQRGLGNQELQRTQSKKRPFEMRESVNQTRETVGRARGRGRGYAGRGDRIRGGFARGFGNAKSSKMGN